MLCSSYASLALKGLRLLVFDPMAEEVMEDATYFHSRPPGGFPGTRGIGRYDHSMGECQPSGGMAPFCARQLFVFELIGMGDNRCCIEFHDIEWMLCDTHVLHEYVTCKDKS